MRRFGVAAALLPLACVPPGEEDPRPEAGTSPRPDGGIDEVALPADVGAAAALGSLAGAGTGGTRRTRALGPRWSSYALPGQKGSAVTALEVGEGGLILIGAGPGKPARAPRRSPISHQTLLSHLHCPGGAALWADDQSYLGPEADRRLFPWEDPLEGPFSTNGDAIFQFRSPAEPHLLASESCTGRPLWRRPLGPRERGLGVFAVGGQLVVAIGERYEDPDGGDFSPRVSAWWLESLDADTGALLAQTQRLVGEPTSFAAAEELLVVASTDDNLVPVWADGLRAYSTKALELLWHRALKNHLVAVGERGPVIAMGDDAFHVLDRATGRTRRRVFDRNMDAVDQVDVDERGLFYSGGDRVTAVELPGGQRRWRRRIPGLGDLLLAGDALYVATGAAFVEALDRERGTTSWSWSIGRDFRMALPASADGGAELVVDDEAGGVWTFGRGPRPAPLETAVIEGRLLESAGEVQALLVGGKRVELDREGRFRAELRARGSTFSVTAGWSSGLPVFLAPADGPYGFADSVPVEVDAGRRASVVLGFARTLVPEDCH